MKYAFHYTLREDGPAGEIIEATVPEEPFVYTKGDEDVLPGLAKAVCAASVGQPLQVLIPCSEAYGPELDDAYAVLPKSQFVDDQGLDEDVLKEGEVVLMRDDNGNEIHGVVVEVVGDNVEVDFNHPLCGIDLHFEVHLMSVTK
jgi:FKBP-type peptidyl-prolyl cis-trans isomerase 2